MDAILSFATTRGTIRAEQLLLAAGEPVRVMPRPAEIAAGCGICLRVAPDARERAVALLETGGAAAQAVHVAVEARYKPLPLPVFTRALGLRRGDALAVVGCAGKTALINRLAAENRYLPVLLSTSTHIRMPDADVVDRVISGTASEPLRPGVALACMEDGEKLRGIDADALDRLRPADGLTLVEADGSRGLPLKAWAEHEPVVPPFTTMTVGVCAMNPIGSPCGDGNTHRPELFRRLVGIADGEVVDIGHVERMVRAMFIKAIGRRTLFINQVETPELEAFARNLAARFAGSGLRVITGSVRDGQALVVDAGNGGNGDE